MIVIPAIDLINGQPVRLYQGNYDQKHIVAASALETAASFVKDGAERIHVVDLDGAKLGKPVNQLLITKIVSSVSVPVEVGGGIRTMANVEFYLNHGVETVILGTAAINDPTFLQEALKKYGHHIAVGLDCRNGYAMASGWLETSSLYYLDFAKKLADLGVSSIIYTDISKDGTLKGPAFDQLAALQKTVDLHITASGGIHSLEDIEKLEKMGLYGAITGQAVYSGKLDLKRAVALTKEKA